MTRVRQCGVTLIELIASITVIALAGTALLGTLSYLNGKSGETFGQAQAQSIANAYLSEVLSKAYTDPDGAAEVARAAFDDINDYNGLVDAVATDRFGNAMGAFTVRVNVVAGALGGLPAASVRRIDVQVDYGDGQLALASGYRVNYP